eukprot:TRINITY_DN1405_c0_g1_i6.p1 TRINITY_DN1405_c0_g1~~TRINITY_DN1405_c0_g1_i6.p1  ORF type:complete len:1224 (+),score=324.70 TRINITY_DN1405_c0_g1_i6:3-3674(+)
MELCEAGVVAMDPQVLDSICDIEDFRVFEIGQLLAEGAFGAVYQAKHKGSNDIVAIKVLSLDDEELDEEEIVNEIAVMKGLVHENIINYYGSFSRGMDLFMVMELCEAGSLTDIYYDLEMHFTEPEIQYIAKHILLALQFMHKLQWVHRDLKGGNVLLTKNGEVRVIDFGTSVQGRQVSGFIGTPYWMAPEVIANQKRKIVYDGRSDIWSLGIICIEIAECDPPNTEYHPMAVLKKIPVLSPPKLKSKKKWSKDFHNFLQCSLVKDPKNRGTSSSLLDHPFIKKAPKKNPLVKKARKVSGNTKFVPLNEDFFPSSESMSFDEDSYDQNYDDNRSSSRNYRRSRSRSRSTNRSKRSRSRDRSLSPRSSRSQNRNRSRSSKRNYTQKRPRSRSRESTIRERRSRSRSRGRSRNENKSLSPRRSRSKRRYRSRSRSSRRDSYNNRSNSRPRRDDSPNRGRSRSHPRRDEIDGTGRSPENRRSRSRPRRETVGTGRSRSRPRRDSSKTRGRSRSRPRRETTSPKARNRSRTRRDSSNSIQKSSPGRYESPTKSRPGSNSPRRDQSPGRYRSNDNYAITDDHIANVPKHQGSRELIKNKVPKAPSSISPGSLLLRNESLPEFELDIDLSANEEYWNNLSKPSGNRKKKRRQRKKGDIFDHVVKQSQDDVLVRQHFQKQRRVRRAMEKKIEIMRKGDHRDDVRQHELVWAENFENFHMDNELERTKLKQEQKQVIDELKLELEESIQHFKNNQQDDLFILKKRLQAFNHKKEREITKKYNLDAETAKNDITDPKALKKKLNSLKKAYLKILSTTMLELKVDAAKKISNFVIEQIRMLHHVASEHLQAEIKVQSYHQKIRYDLYDQQNDKEIELKNQKITERTELSFEHFKDEMSMRRTLMNQVHDLEQNQLIQRHEKESKEVTKGYNKLRQKYTKRLKECKKDGDNEEAERCEDRLNRWKTKMVDYKNQMKEESEALDAEQECEKLEFEETFKEKSARKEKNAKHLKIEGRGLALLTKLHSDDQISNKLVDFVHKVDRKHMELFVESEYKVLLERAISDMKQKKMYIKYYRTVLEDTPSTTIEKEVEKLKSDILEIRERIGGFKIGMTSEIANRWKKIKKSRKSEQKKVISAGKERQREIIAKYHLKIDEKEPDLLQRRASVAPAPVLKLKNTSKQLAEQLYDIGPTPEIDIIYYGLWTSNITLPIEEIDDGIQKKHKRRSRIPRKKKK